MIITKNVFSSGALGSAIAGRTDTKQYAQGVSEALNTLVNPQGTLVKRQGSTSTLNLSNLHAGLKSGEFRLIDYSFDINNRYALILMPNKMLVMGIDDEAVRVTIDTPWGAEDIKRIQYSSFGNLVYMVDGKHPMQQLSRKSTSNFTLEKYVYTVPPMEDAVLTKVLTADPPTPPTIDTDIILHLGDSLTVAGILNDGLLERTILSAGSSFEGVIKLIDTTAMTVTVLVTRVGDILKGDKLDILGQPSAFLQPSGELSVGKIAKINTVKSLTDPATVKTVDPTQGQFLSVGGGLIKIDHANSTDELIQGTVLVSVVDDNSTGIFAFLDNAFGGNEQPVAISQWAGKLWLGGTPRQRQRLWGSKTDDYGSFYVGVLDSDGIEMDLVSQKTANIRWLADSQAGLIAGCTGSEIIIKGRDKLVTPTTVTQYGASSIGSDVQQPVEAQNTLLFVSNDTTKVWSYAYDYQNDTYRGFDTTITNPDIMGSGIVALATVSNPWQSTYCLLTDGTMAVAGSTVGATPIYGWTTHAAGGFIEAFCVLSGRPTDTVVCLVERFGEFYVEQSTYALSPKKTDTFMDFTRVFGQGDITPVSLAWDHKVYLKVDYTDMHKVWGDTSSFSCTWNGELLPRPGLEDGYFLIEVSGLDSSQINDPDAVVKIGLDYEVRINSLPIQYQGEEGELTFTDTELGEIKLLVWDSSRNIIVNGQRVITRHSSDVSSESPSLYTGVLDVEESMIQENGAMVGITEQSPYPFNLNGFWVEVK